MFIDRSPEAKIRAGRALSALLEEYQSVPILLLLSGGSAFDILPYVSSEVLGEHLTVGVLDERCTQDEQKNNFLQLSETDFFEQLIWHDVSVIDTSMEPGETCEEMAERFDGALRTWQEAHPNGVLLATMGIGPDGHTAGILRVKDDAMFDGDAWVVGYHVPLEVNPHTERVTTTYTFLREVIDAVVVYAVGEEKQKWICALEEDRDVLKTVPARIIKDMKHVQIFTDI